MAKANDEKKRREYLLMKATWHKKQLETTEKKLEQLLQGSRQV